MKYILNFGAGVNSTALLFEIVKKSMPLDYVIFADTGSELPETYVNVELIKGWCKERSISFIIVKSKYNCSIYDYYFNKRTMPFRKFRDCTYKFKKIPITKFLKQFKEEGVTQYIGIAGDEAHRCRISETKWITFEYPLVQWLWSRQKCIDIIKEEGFPIPVKSGCFFCPFQNYKAWGNLWEQHPELFNKSREMEEGNRSYPKNTLCWSGNLKQYEQAFKTQTKINEYETEGRTCNPVCKSGYCML